MMVFGKNKAVSLLPALFAALFVVVSCDPEEKDEESEFGEILWTETSGTTITNTKHIVIGDMQDDMTYVRKSTILSSAGKTIEVMLECPAMSAIPLLDGYEDTLRKVTDVTLINKGTITVHTKNIVEHFKDQVRTTDDPDRPYYYLRLIGLFGGENSTLINEGLIDVYFDHDKDTPFTVYCFAMIGGEGSEIINKGTIRFHGNGSPRTRLRCVGTFGDNVKATNQGTMEAEVEMVEDSRMITSGGSYSTFINDGIMRMRQPGKMMGITRYGDNVVVNNNLIEMTSVDDPSWAKTVLDPEDHFICALYEPLNPTHQEMPELVNNGTIKMKIEGSANTHPRTQAYGLFFDAMGPAHKVVDVVNTGNIYVSQTGPQNFNIAEVGLVTRDNMMAITSASIRVIKWNTELRDFSKTKDLFLAKGANVDFTGAKILLEKADGYVDRTSYSVAPEALINMVSNCNYSGYDDISFQAADGEHLNINWDKDSKTVSLYAK